MMRLLALSFFLIAVSGWATDTVKVGSKKFTEGVILGEMITTLLETSQIPAQHHAELGGTRILWNALLSGDIDIYAEYSGTLREELLPDQAGQSENSLQKALAAKQIRMSRPLGFNDSYAIGMRKDVARRFGIEALSDLARFPTLKFGFSNEFKSRADGWPRLQKAYHLPQKEVRGLDHEIAYPALQSGDIDALDLYSTDAEIQYYNLQALKDDSHIFPRYEAVILYRMDLEKRAKDAVSSLKKLEASISETEMIAMNARAKLDRVSAAHVASDFLQKKFGIGSKVKEQSVAERISQRLNEHLNLVFQSMSAAILVAVPLGIVAASFPRFGQFILSMVGIIQTFPALALLVMLIRPLKALGLPGIGDTPAVVALFLYSLLPMVRNTYAGLQNIPNHIRESAEALGLSRTARLRLIELPLASPTILAGIQTAAVINVGFATLGALIGAGGFGQPILAGIRLDDYSLILEGAVPSALLAVATQGLFELASRWLVPRGLKSR